ncbi:LysE family translocator [Thiolapillus brandeum]|uniref:Translocator protein, LysE family n=1 Tax=Thiolapillus brandeum TaxID=1076588 RepID=A0A7U6GJC5_9GAMM|nr:LysE family translocator [Thiolapillus brandeum]BAO44711.1 translocator protein, LysE family [Thiolapillus brandeum]
MSISEIVMLSVSMALLAAIPSISVALVVARSATLGVGNGIAASAGIVLGDLIYVFLAITGLSAMAETMGGLFLIVRLLGGLYLVWLGYRLLIGKRAVSPVMYGNWQGRGFLASFIAGMLLTLGDIKAIVFYASLLPVFIDLSNVGPSTMIAVIVINPATKYACFRTQRRALNKAWRAGALP